ncbi:DUF1080 domain-containing protein [Rubripirellula sp.]|jgi:hypothetical protein|nr:DUF1080 domain-containing protein [Rubripirellula sp.]
MNLNALRRATSFIGDLTRYSLLTCLLLLSISDNASALDSGSTTIALFHGEWSGLWECRENAWFVDQDKSLTCRMEQVLQKNGKIRTRGMGYLWTRNTYSDFILDLEYRLSPKANSGVFFRADPANPVQGGFEIQLLDNASVEEAAGRMDPKKQNGALYDCQSPSVDSALPVGQWNRLRLTCRGQHVTVEINGKKVNDIDLSQWVTARMNPDGSVNKFEQALNTRPKTGRIGFQNHGNQVWFRDIKVTNLKQ